MAATNNLKLFFIIIGFIIWAGFTFWVVKEHKNKIRDYLKKKKATSITISWFPFYFNQNKHTYNVKYIDEDGKKHSRSCKIYIPGSIIHWEDEEENES